MKLQTHRFELPLEHPFTIARGTRHVQRSLIVELEHEGVRGYGRSSGGCRTPCDRVLG